MRYTERMKMIFEIWIILVSVFCPLMLYFFIIREIENTKAELIKHIRAADVILRRIELQVRRIK